MLTIVELSIGLLVVYLIITVIRNILEPKIVGSQIGLHPIVTLASMFVGAQLFGILGLFGFPIFLSLLRVCGIYRHLRISAYFSQTKFEPARKQNIVCFGTMVFRNCRVFLFKLKWDIGNDNKPAVHRKVNTYYAE